MIDHIKNMPHARLRDLKNNITNKSFNVFKRNKLALPYNDVLFRGH